jgi:hypothetical protein
LIAAISRLPEAYELVLTTREGDSIKFEADGNNLTAHVAERFEGNSDADIWYETNGWSLSSDSPRPRWERSIDWPPQYRKYEAIADAVIYVFRERLGVTHPADIGVEVN